MTREEAIGAIYQGHLVHCSASEYWEQGGVREALQDFAGEMIDQNQDIRAILAFEEVRRLDAMYPHPALM